MTIGRTLISQAPAFQVGPDTLPTHGHHIATVGPTAAVARSLGMIALALFAILVLLPAVAEQAAAAV